MLWPPEADAWLYVEGSSSRVCDIDRWNDDDWPRYRASVGYRLECELGPGDVLFIPALWFHNVTSIGFSVALNVFWRSHPEVHALYDAKDLYGNRDPPPATRALAHVDAAAAELAALPSPFREFYVRRAIRALEAAVRPSQPLTAVHLPINGCDGVAAAAAIEPTGSAASDGAGGPRVRLASGSTMPLLGLGTWELGHGEAAIAAVRAALAVGVRHIDCASIYRNETAVGDALHAALCAGTVTRAELFVTSKLWHTDHGRVRASTLSAHHTPATFGTGRRLTDHEWARRLQPAGHLQLCISHALLTVCSLFAGT